MGAAADGAPAARGSAVEHPLVGTRFASPTARDQFEVRVDPREHPWLDEHRVAGATLLPATAHLELMRAAATAHHGTPMQVEALTFAEALVLDERFEYLRLGGGVGRETFGFDRHINQQFYMSHEWQTVRRHVMIRDEGCDLGVPGYEILHGPLIHHMNPMTVDDVVHGEDWILDPEFLITTTHSTHNAIHYGVEKLAPKVVTERFPQDTKLW